MHQMVAYEMLSQSKIIKQSALKCDSGRLAEVVVYERFQLYLRL